VEDQVVTQGAMKAGKLEGRFVYTLPNGEKQTENYKDGDFIGFWFINRINIIKNFAYSI